MDEAQVLADRVAVIAERGHRRHGDARLDRGPPHGDSPDPFRAAPPGRDGGRARARRARGDRRLSDGRRTVEMATDSPTPLLYRVTSWAVEHGVELEGLEVTRPSLEDVYLLLTAEETGNEGATDRRKRALVPAGRATGATPSAPSSPSSCRSCSSSSSPRSTAGTTTRGFKLDQYFIPGIMTFGVISACYTNIAVALATQREEGILKRSGHSAPALGLHGRGRGQLRAPGPRSRRPHPRRRRRLLRSHLSRPLLRRSLVLIVVLGSSDLLCPRGRGHGASSRTRTRAGGGERHLPPAHVHIGTFFPLSSGSVLAKIALYFPIRPFILAAFNVLDPRFSTGDDRRAPGWRTSPSGAPSRSCSRSGASAGCPQRRA